MSQTPLSAEAAVLHAVIEDDYEHARHLLSKFLSSELAELHHKLGDVQTLVAEAAAKRGPREEPWL